MRSALRFASLLVVPAIVFPAPFAARMLIAQEAPAAAPATAGGIRGTVIDAETAAGLAGSIVTLIPRDGAGAFPPSPGEARFVNARTTSTTPAGAYAFGDVGAGAYTILVHRGGYEPARVDVEVGTAEARVSIGLLVQPVRLQAVRVEASRDAASTLSFAAGDDSSRRIRAALERQKLFLAGDVREMTSGETQEALALGSSDLLLAMQRLPGVTHTSEHSATMWVRGSRWDHTRVYFDGVPLYQPLSALGALSGVNPSAVGTAFLLPGVRPVSLGGDGIARIELRTSPGTPDGKLRGSGELSLWGATGALGYRRDDDAAGMQLTARQGLNDVFSTEIAPGPYGVMRQPASFRYDEATARADTELGNGRLTFSGIYSRDELVPPYAEYAVRQDWRTLAGRMTYTLPLGKMTLSQTVGASTFEARRQQPLLNGPGFPWDSVPVAPMNDGARQAIVSTRIGTSPEDASGWGAGVDLVSLRTTFDGSRQFLFWGDSSMADTSGRASNRYASVWAERRWRLSDRITIETGVRGDAGGKALAAVRPAFTALARYGLSDATTVSAGLGRTHQYQQQVPTPVGRLWFRADNIAQPWVVAGESVPVLTADVATAGIERWQGDGVLLGGNVFARRSRGMVARGPRPGPIAPGPWFVVGRESAYGLEVSARKLTGRVTGMLGYSWQRARTEASGLRFASDASVPHALDAAATVRLGAWRLGAGHTLTSGAPVTLITGGKIVTYDSLSGEWVTETWGPTAGRPNSRRQPVFSRLDLFADWTRRFGRSSATFFAGMQTIFPAGQDPSQFSYTCGDRPVIDCMEEIPLRRSTGVAPSLGLRLSF